MTKWDLPQECRSGTTYENMVSRIKGKKSFQLIEKSIWLFKNKIFKVTKNRILFVLDFQRKTDLAINDR